MRRAALLTIVLAVAMLVLPDGEARAHSRSSSTGASAPTATVPSASSVPGTSVERIIAAAPETALPWLALTALAGVVIAAASRRRRVTVFMLIAVVVLLVFETGVHSTHHLGKPEESAQCSVASVSGHLSADVIHGVVVAAPGTVPDLPCPVVSTCAPAGRVIGPDAGRAPPLSA